MRNPKHFLLHERQTITSNIDRLEKSLSDYTHHDSRARGQQAMLKLQREHLEFINELLQYADDPPKLETMTIFRMESMQTQHNQAIIHDYPHYGHHSGEWWDTLERLEYLRYLTRKITELTIIK